MTPGTKRAEPPAMYPALQEHQVAARSADRRISRTTSRPTVTIRDMGRKWPCADWRRHAERTGASMSVAETPQRKGMQQPALTVSVVPALVANVAKLLESRLPAGVGPLARPDHLTQQDVGAR